MTSNIPTVTFNNGIECPILGLGTWKSQPYEVTDAVKHAIDVGYRHIDCAHVYNNEREVGKAIGSKICEGVVKRKDLFITGKLWNTYHHPESVERAINKTLKHMGLDYLDLYLIHWPFAFKEGDELFPTYPDGKYKFSDVDYLDTWGAMEALQRKGLARSIGISNFNRAQIERLLDTCTIAPVTNQIECTPYLNQQQLIDFCKCKDIIITAYSPLGSPDRPNIKSDQPVLLKDCRLKRLSEKYRKTIAQVVLGYQVQRGNITIPKSVNKVRISENYNIFDFEITAEDMVSLNGMDCNGRFCAFEENIYHKYYPFHDIY